jgi:hypothetical protein
MKKRGVPLKMFRFTRMLVVGLLSIAGMFILLTYGPLRAQSSRAQKSNFDMAQLSADARTVVAAIAYVLEPEPESPVPNTASTDQWVVLVTNQPSSS